MEIHPTEMSQGEKDCEECLTSTISAKLHEGAQKAKSLFSSACIYRVPEKLRKLNASAYTPQLIAIGPLHQNDKYLQTPMQQVKMSYANHLLCRLTEGVEDREPAERKRFSLLQECVAEMKLSIDDAKKCYAEEVKLDVEMMLVDGCFILELLYRNHFGEFIGKIDSSHLMVGSDDGYSKETMTASTELQPLSVPESRIEVERSRTIEEISETMTASTELQPLPVPESRIEVERSHTIEEISETMTASTELQPLSVPESRIEVESSRTIDEISGLQTEDPIFDNRLTYCTVHHDLLLLENQIPYLVLEKLFPLTVGRIQSGPYRLSLTGYLVHYFGKKMIPEGNSTDDHVLRVLGNKMDYSEPEEGEVVPSRPSANHYHHILHKVHDGYLPLDHTRKTKLNKMMPSATELVYAGVKFELGTGDNLFKVKFTESQGPFWWCRRARFEIPKLVIEDSTESLLRNLIAFEQCCPGVPQHFTSYAILMDMLVDSDKDVQVLEEAGVVQNCLGASEDAANLFNKLCKEIVLGKFFFADICDRAHNYRRSFWPKNFAHVRRKYFASPWTFIAFCLAFCAVGISITQFFRSFSWP